MAKITLEPNSFPFPMPMTLVGANVGGRPNFQAVAFIGVVNYKPITLCVGLGPKHHTVTGIKENRMFSVNVPSKDLIVQTDYCGIVSGKDVDKSAIFSVFYGDLKTAPMIDDCPITMECVLLDSCKFNADEVFFGEIKRVYGDESILTSGQLDFNKIHPFFLTMPDNRYWELGAGVGKAWKDGKQLKKTG